MSTDHPSRYRVPLVAVCAFSCFLWTVPTASSQIEGVVYIINAQSGRYLDADTATIKSDGTKVQLYGTSGQGMSNRQWQIDNVGNNIYSIRNLQSGRYLDADTATINSDGTKIQLFGTSVAGARNRQWKIQPAGNDTFLIVNVQSNRKLDADTATISADGTKVQLYGTDGGVKNRQWKIVPVRSGSTKSNPQNPPPRVVISELQADARQSAKVEISFRLNQQAPARVGVARADSNAFTDFDAMLLRSNSPTSFYYHAFVTGLRERTKYIYRIRVTDSNGGVHQETGDFYTAGRID